MQFFGMAVVAALLVGAAADADDAPLAIDPSDPGTPIASADSSSADSATTIVTDTTGDGIDPFLAAGPAHPRHLGPRRQPRLAVVAEDAALLRGEAGLVTPRR